LELFRFIDGLLALPAELEQQFSEQLHQYEAAMSRPYITSIERRGIEQGERRGLQRALAAERALLKSLAQRQWGEPVAAALATLVADIPDPERLTEIGGWIFDCPSAEELLARVRAVLAEGCPAE
jgi:hypothetical protein